MGARIARCFVETYAGNTAIHIRTEFYSQFGGRAGVGRRGRRRCENCRRTSWRRRLRRRRAADRSTLGEYYIDPILACQVAHPGNYATGAGEIDAVTSINTVPERVERCVIGTRVLEISRRVIECTGGMVGSDISRIRRDRNRCGEIQLLPTTAALTGKRAGGQQRSTR